jgi:outer membrane murein-binding lipoprotein Lpp
MAREDGKINDISRSIGRLESKVDSLVEDFKAEQTYSHNNNHELRNAVTVINATLAPLVKDVNEMRPAVNDWKNARLKAGGAVLMLSLVWGALAMFMSEFKAIILRVFH